MDCTVLSLNKSTFDKPLRNTPTTFLIIFSVYLGNYVYKFFQDFLLRKENPLYKINLLHHFVTATAYGVLIVYRQNSISGVIGLLFEGSVLVFEFNSLLRLLGVNRNSWFFLCVSTLRLVVTVLLRAICPTVLLVITLSTHSPLSLEYVPLGFFFMNIVFFSMINGWHVKISFESLKKRLLARRLSYYYSRPRANSDSNLNSMELNNINSVTQTLTRTALPVIIPTDANFRLSSPVSKRQHEQWRSIQYRCLATRTNFASNKYYYQRYASNGRTDKWSLKLSSTILTNIPILYREKARKLNEKSRKIYLYMDSPGEVDKVYEICAICYKIKYLF